MAEKRQFLDVWIVETNTVYKEVPFTVVTDWVQQGRLLADDMLKPSGTKDWQRLGSLPSFAAYLPRSEPFRAEDKAEALESVHVDFGWKQRSETEEEDVDMIPLIDVSLVLLIFFMMTATAATSASLINMPATEFGNTLVNDPGMLWIGIDRVDGQPVYSLGKGEQGPQPDDRKLTEAEALQRLEARLQEGGSGEVRIVADRLLPYDVVKRMTALLEQRRGQGVRKIYGGVIERENP